MGLLNRNKNKKPSGKNVRDSKSGRFVAKGEAKKRPATTVSESRSRSSRKKVCPDCDGKQLNKFDYTQLCPTCGGEGKVKA